MKNREKYKDEIKRYIDNSHNSFCNDFVNPKVLKVDSCDGCCVRCHAVMCLWLDEEYEEPSEPQVDWSKVAVDTPILVRNYEDRDWQTAHFSKCVDGVVHAPVDGRTSWTDRCVVLEIWKYAKLPELEGAE